MLARLTAGVHGDYPVVRPQLLPEFHIQKLHAASNERLFIEIRSLTVLRARRRIHA